MSETPRPVRAPIPATVYRLGAEPRDNLLLSTTPAERIEMVWLLTARMWELAGLPPGRYTRATMPGRVVRRP